MMGIWNMNVVMKMVHPLSKKGWKGIFSTPFRPFYYFIIWLYIFHKFSAGFLRLFQICFRRNKSYF